MSDTDEPAFDPSAAPPGGPPSPPPADGPPEVPAGDPPRPWGTYVALAILAVLPFSALYTVDAREVAIVTQFGAPVRTVLEPGLYLRAPWPLQEVVRFDRRARLLPVPAAETLTRDKKNLVVEPFLVWRVEDPGRFLEAVGTPEAAETQLSDLVVSRIAGALGKREFSDLMAVGEGGELVPAELKEAVAAIASERLGVAVLDLRLRHVGLPLQNEQSIYERMRAERSRIANAYRSEGEERAAAIRAGADREAAEIRARSEEEAARIEAAAAAGVARRYAEAHARDPELFRLVRGLDAWENTLGSDDLVVLPTDSPLAAPLWEPARKAP